METSLARCCALLLLTAAISAGPAEARPMLRGACVAAKGVGQTPQGEHLR